MTNHKMLNHKNWILCLGLTLLTAGFSRAQVVSPSQIKDAHLRSLQLQYNSELSAVGREILAAKFDYPFYLSLALDLDQARQQRVVQRSLRFEEFNERTVLAISGNYFAAYSEDKLNGESRARDSFLSVVLPILKAAVPRFQSSPDVQGYAVEISHHVLGSAMKVAVEQPENLMVFLPQADAVRLVASSDVNIQQSALLNGQAFLNGEPISIWLNTEIPPCVLRMGLQTLRWLETSFVFLPATLRPSVLTTPLFRQWRHCRSPGSRPSPE